MQIYALECLFDNQIESISIIINNTVGKCLIPSVTWYKSTNVIIWSANYDGDGMLIESFESDIFPFTFVDPIKLIKISPERILSASNTQSVKVYFSFDVTLPPVFDVTIWFIHSESQNT